MKRYFLMAVLLSATAITKAQDTYLNDRVTATDDVNGSSRYVGMGGALGALGADISVIGSNPAGIGLYRKSEIGFTFGAVVPTGGKWNSAEVNGEKLAKASFDQMGFVWSIKLDSDKLKYVNFAANYQKKANYNLGFFADNPNLGGLSQMDQVAELASLYDEKGLSNLNALAGLAAFPVQNDVTLNNTFLTYDTSDKVYKNLYPGSYNKYARHQWGSLQAYDMNLSFNVKERFYTGVTLGLDHVDYRSWSDYAEYNATGTSLGGYILQNDREITGHGVNVKVGFLIRPVEDNPFRIGLAIETPTWYSMQNSTYMCLKTDDVSSDEMESRIETTVRTPWRSRLSLGSTVDKVLAWGVEYEYANMAKTAMGYPSYDYYDASHNSYMNTSDFIMDKHTKGILRGQHTLKAGLEVKPIDKFAIRVGYNFISSRYKKNPTFDQCQLNSPAMDYEASTDFMSLGATNIVTFGFGYKYKKFYADLAYKYRMQNADFYAFDTGFTSNAQFIADNPTLAGAQVQPVDVNLNRHQVQLSLGFKF